MGIKLMNFTKSKNNYTGSSGWGKKKGKRKDGWDCTGMDRYRCEMLPPLLRNPFDAVDFNSDWRTKSTTGTSKRWSCLIPSRSSDNNSKLLRGGASTVLKDPPTIIRHIVEFPLSTTVLICFVAVVILMSVRVLGLIVQDITTMINNVSRWQFFINLVSNSADYRVDWTKYILRYLFQGF